METPANIRAALEQRLGLTGDAAPTRRRLLWIGGGVLVAFALVLWLFSGDGERTRYTTQLAERGDLVVTVTATGTLQPTNQVVVGSELSGTIRSVMVDWNDAVHVGQVLAKLDTTRLEAQVLQTKAATEAARARVVQAEASLAEARSQEARLLHVREISGGKVPSQSELDSAKATTLRTQSEVASAEASVAQARATLDAQETDLRKAEIRSPIDGIVLSRAIEPGQTVAASLQAPVLFTLAEDLTRMELHVSVDEADVGQVREGQAATFSVDAWPEREFSARVSQVRSGATALEGVVTYETLLAVDNSDHALRPGMTATAEIVVQEKSGALLVPNAALRWTPPVRVEAPSGGALSVLLPGSRRWGNSRRNGDSNHARKTRVFVLRGGAPQELEVATGASDGTYTEETSGALEPGTELIVDAIAVSP